MLRILDYIKKNQSPFFRIGLLLTLVITCAVLISLFYMPYSPTAMDRASRSLGISLRHPMGTDNFGRDIFCRVLYGTRVTLLIALGTVAIGTTAGILIGALCGYFGGLLDEIVMRINDALFAFPSILLALVFVSLMGTGNLQLVLSLGIAFIPSFSRIVRGEFLRARSMDYVLNARLQGASHLRIMFVHILPNIRGVLLSSVMIGFNNAVLAEAGLSFLGIGTQPPFDSLGQMLSDARINIMSEPRYMLGPGIVLILLVLGFSLLGEGLRTKT
ncbi:MAG: ABC transporter permease [Lachnospiraceae bacterium]|nr:ABC transporter permease [Lachnospiraceae bacterium]